MGAEKHTPLPWRYEPHTSDRGDEIYGHVITGLDGAEIIYWDEQGRPREEANAELIVTAVNERTALQERVRVLEEALKPFADCVREMPDDVVGLVSRISAGELNDYCFFRARTAISEPQP